MASFKVRRLFPGRSESWNWIDFRVRSVDIGFNVADFLYIRLGYFSRKSPSLKNAFAVRSANVSYTSEESTLFSLTGFNFSTHGAGMSISYGRRVIRLGVALGFFYSVIEENLSSITFMALEERLRSRMIRGEKWSLLIAGGVGGKFGILKWCVNAGLSLPVTQNQVILTLTTTSNYFNQRETVERDFFSSSRKADKEIFVNSALSASLGRFEPFVGVSFIVQNKEVFLFPVSAGWDGLFSAGLRVNDLMGMDFTGGMWYEYLHYPDPSPSVTYVLKYASKGAGISAFKRFKWGKAGFGIEVLIFDGVILNHSLRLSDLDGVELNFRILTEFYGS